MSCKLTIGRYYHASSIVHRLNPTVKSVCALLLILASFFVKTPLQLAFFCLIAIALLALAHIPVRHVLRSAVPVAWVLTVLALCNLLLVRGGDTLVAAGFVVITSAGVWAAILYPVRVFAAILIGMLLMLTTTPNDLGKAFDTALSPLSRIGLPGHELAMVFSLMLRFIPTLSADATSITEAQEARGGSARHGSLIQRCRALQSITVALIASSLRHAENLARALDARNYVAADQRTSWRQTRFTFREAASLLVTAAVIAGIFVLALV